MAYRHAVQWDCCERCYATVNESHPYHDLVAIRKADDHIVRKIEYKTLHLNIRCDRESRSKRSRCRAMSLTNCLPCQIVMAVSWASATSALTRTALTLIYVKTARRSRKLAIPLVIR